MRTFVQASDVNVFYTILVVQNIISHYLCVGYRPQYLSLTLSLFNLAYVRSHVQNYPNSMCGLCREFPPRDHDRTQSAQPQISHTCSLTQQNPNRTGENNCGGLVRMLSSRVIVCMYTHVSVYMRKSTAPHTRTHTHTIAKTTRSVLNV